MLTNVKAGETRQDNSAQQHEREHDANFKCFACDLGQAVSRGKQVRELRRLHKRHTGPKLSPPEVIDTRPASMFTHT